MTDKTARTKVALPAKQQASAQPLGSVKPRMSEINAFNVYQTFDQPLPISN
jgi:hypothetical protein